MEQAFLNRLHDIHASLGIAADYLEVCRLPLCPEPEQLTEVGPDFYQRPQQLTPEAARAWAAMREAAASDDISLHLISAFRSIDYQCNLIRRKLEAGRDIADILKVNAAPGFSEHHTGRAIDLNTDGCPVLEEQFEQTPAFTWLQANASRFGFHLSYPRDNACGISYEPWHWCYLPATATP